MSLDKEIRTLNKIIAGYNKKISELRGKLVLAYKRKKLKCTHCGKCHPVGKLTYLQDHWYVAPYGCTGGDYNKQGEGLFQCPSCNGYNRDYDNPKIKEFKYYFKKHKDVKSRRKGLSCKIIIDDF